MFKKKGSHTQGTHSHRVNSSSAMLADEAKAAEHGYFSGESANALNFQMFNPAFTWTGLSNFGEAPRLGLSYDIFQEGDNLIVEIPFPRLNSESLTITQENRLLKVSGVTESLTQETKKGASKIPLFVQIPRGYFSQVIQLPLAVYEEGADASYKDGVLTISFKIIGSGRENKINVSI